MYEKELRNVIYNVAIVFLMNDFPSMCEWRKYKRARSFGKRPFQGKQGMFVIIHQK